ncbi:MAG: DHHA1 domain-containing protein [archaeon]|jgi:single-stranded DNA-specific DHH superfamily exonuclease
MPGKAKGKKKVVSSKKIKSKPKVSSKPLPKPLSGLEFTQNRALSFLELNQTKRIAIISDNDPDGMTSAVQMKKFLDSKKVGNKVFFYDHYSNSLSSPNDIFAKFSPEKTIFLDLNEGFISDVLLQIGKFTGPFLVIDHHQAGVIRNNSYRCIVIKPASFTDIQPSRYPVSKMVHDLFGGNDWVCEIGVIGDFAFEQWADFLRKTEKKYNFSYAKFKELDDLVTCITSQYPEKMISLFEFICSAKNPKDLLHSEFFAFKKLFDSKLAEQIKKFEESAECFNDVQICFFQGEVRFSSKLSNLISIKNPSKVIVIFEQPGELIKCSIRRQDFKVSCNDLAKAAVSGTPLGKGGGHIPAAGATFPKEYLDEFKKRARLYLLENPPKSTS